MFGRGWCADRAAVCVLRGAQRPFLRREKRGMRAQPTLCMSEQRSETIKLIYAISQRSKTRGRSVIPPQTTVPTTPTLCEAGFGLTLPPRMVSVGVSAAKPPGEASPDQKSWDTAPGSHRWLGARVAWEFGKDIYAGTCTGWKKKDKLLGCAIWFIRYDDGDSEVFDVANMRYSLRLFGASTGKRRVRARRTPQPLGDEVEAAAPASRRS